MSRAAAALRRPLALFVVTRAALWLLALTAVLLLDPSREDAEDPAPREGGPLILEVWARWDSRWLLELARHGYRETADAAFYPLYPLLVGGLGRLLLGQYVLAGVLVSLAAGAAGFVVLHRLAVELLGERAAVRALLLLALFPTAFFLQAVYTESLFLLLAASFFLCARRGAIVVAGASVGLALLTRPTAFALLPSLALLAYRHPDRRRAAAALGLPAAMFAAYPLLLWYQLGDAFAFLRAEDSWYRETSMLGPLHGVHLAAQAAWAGGRQLLQGSDERWFWVEENADAVALANIELLAFLVLFALLAVVAWRRLGAEYGLFAAASLALPLSLPTHTYPLLSMHRLGLVVFPLFLAGALLARTPRRLVVVLVPSGLLLALHLAEWVSWQWVA